MPAYVFSHNNSINRFDIFGLEDPPCVCPSGSHKGKKQFTPDRNGCGPGWATWVPDSPMLIVTGGLSACSFIDACQGHDTCYGTCGRSQMGCDASFLKAMSSTCYGCAYDNFGKAWTIFINPMFYIYLSACQGYASTYYLAVSGAGTASFFQAQGESCKDCCCE